METVEFATPVATILGTSTTTAVTPAGLDYERPYIDVRSYGTVGNGVANDAAAIQAALDATAPTADTVVFPPGTYNIGSTGLTASCSIHMMPGASIRYSGTGTALLLDNADDKVFRLDVRRVSVTWHTGVDTSSIGVRFRNSDYVRADVLAHNFNVGVDLHGDNAGTSYGEFNLRNVMDNKVGFRCSQVGTGWANQHEVRGQIRINSSYPGVVGSRYIDLTGAGNNITFVNVTLENGMPEFTADIKSPYNAFINCRFESASGIRYDGTNCEGNLILGGYNVLNPGGGGVPITLINSADDPLILTTRYAQFGATGPYINAASPTISQFVGQWRFSTAPQMSTATTARKIHLGVNVGDPGIYAGAGTPEGAVTAPLGSHFHRSDGGAGTSFYVKEAGSGNTGWVAK